jgi:FkbM family methyltransferase
LFQFSRRLLLLAGIQPEKVRILREVKRFLQGGPELFPYPTFPPEHKPLKEIIRPGDIVIDVGANVGDYALLFEQWGAEVFAFEPTHQFATLVSRAAGKNIHCNNVALGSKRGHITIYESGRQSSSNKSWSDSFAPSTARRCPVRRLDDFEFRRIDFIKTDTDGMDWEVLKGAKKLLHTHHPKVFCEINEDALALRGLAGQSLIQWMCAQGYSWRIFSHDVRHYDVLFSPLDPAK